MTRGNEVKGFPLWTFELAIKEHQLRELQLHKTNQVVDEDHPNFDKKVYWNLKWNTNTRPDQSTVHHHTCFSIKLKGMQYNLACLLRFWTIAYLCANKSTKRPTKLKAYFGNKEEKEEERRRVTADDEREFCLWFWLVCFPFHLNDHHGEWWKSTQFLHIFQFKEELSVELCGDGDDEGPGDCSLESGTEYWCKLYFWFGLMSHDDHVQCWRFGRNLGLLVYFWCGKLIWIPDRYACITIFTLKGAH